MKSLLLLALCVLLPFTGLQACQCYEKPTVKKALKKADLVVVGKVLTKEIVLLKDGDIGRVISEDSVMHFLFEGVMEARYRVQALEKYKGASRLDTIVIITGIGGGDCGYSFSTGEKYILYVNKNEKTRHLNDEEIFTTSICTRTTEYNKTELKEINRFRKKKNSENRS